MKNVIKIVAAIVAGTIIALSVFLLVSCRDGYAENAQEGYKYTVRWKDPNGLVYEVATNECWMNNGYVWFNYDGKVYRVGWANVIVVQNRGARCGMIDDYISREAAIDDLTHTLFYDQRDKATAKKLIATLPPADVVPVVRCKDCKHMCHLQWLDDETGRAVICAKHSFTGLRSDDWYCADGERKE